MKKDISNDIKLGIFILSSLVFLILLFYMIGKNKNFFGSNFKIRSRFENVQGLKAGNNVRFAGINIGTVDAVNIINDTTLEVCMNIDDNMQNIIKANAVVSIGTDGLVGNKVINITAVKENERFVKQNELLSSKKAIDTDEMLKVLHKTNKDLSVITENLKLTTGRINNSKALWEILSDSSLPNAVHISMNNIKKSSIHLTKALNKTDSIIGHVMKGKGSLGLLLYDTTLSKNVSTAIENIKEFGAHANKLSLDLTYAVDTLNNNINNGNGLIHGLLKDSVLTKKINTSVSNIDKGSEGLTQIIDALKQSFLFRGYFRRLEKKKNQTE